MSTTAQAAGSPVEVTLADQTYRMSPLRDVDYGEFDRWMQVKLIQTARQSLTPDMSDQERQDTMDAAMRQASLLTIASPHGARVASSLDGVAMLLWLGVRQNHPEVTREKIRSQLADPRTVSAAMDSFDLANEVPDAPETSSKSAKKKPMKKRRKSGSR